MKQTIQAHLCSVPLTILTFLTTVTKNEKANFGIYGFKITQSSREVFLAFDTRIFSPFRRSTLAGTCYNRTSEATQWPFFDFHLESSSNRVPPSRYTPAPTTTSCTTRQLTSSGRNSKSGEQDLNARPSCAVPMDR